MRVRRDLLELDSRLRRQGELRVGAYARRAARRRLARAAAGVALILVALALYGILRPPGARNAQGFLVAARCAACGNDVLARSGFGQTPPLVCSACGAVAAHPLWVCRACGERFTTEALEDVVCPRCGGKRVGFEKP
jgi:DNA-directed RNA polymerase subunit RPC12/RpoP